MLNLTTQPTFPFNDFPELNHGISKPALPANSHPVDNPVLNPAGNASQSGASIPSISSSSHSAPNAIQLGGSICRVPTQSVPADNPLLARVSSASQSASSIARLPNNSHFAQNADQSVSSIRPLPTQPGKEDNPLLAQASGASKSVSSIVSLADSSRPVDNSDQSGASETPPFTEQSIIHSETVNKPKDNKIIDETTGQITAESNMNNEFQKTRKQIKNDKRKEKKALKNLSSKASIESSSETKASLSSSSSESSSLPSEKPTTLSQVAGSFINDDFTNNSMFKVAPSPKPGVFTFNPFQKLKTVTDEYALHCTSTPAKSLTTQRSAAETAAFLARLAQGSPRSPGSRRPPRTPRLSSSNSTPKRQ